MSDVNTSQILDNVLFTICVNFIHDLMKTVLGILVIISDLYSVNGLKETIYLLFHLQVSDCSFDSCSDLSQKEIDIMSVTSSYKLWFSEDMLILRTWCNFSLRDMLSKVIFRNGQMKILKTRYFMQISFLFVDMIKTKFAFLPIIAILILVQHG